MAAERSDELLDSKGLAILSPDECWELLEGEVVGRIAFISNGQPLILPVNHVVVGRHIAFLTTRGAKLSAAIMQQPVSFEVDGWNLDDETGWSVLVEGVADVVENEEELENLDHVHLRPWATRVDKSDWIRILPESVTGRRVPPK